MSWSNIYPWINNQKTYKNLKDSVLISQNSIILDCIFQRIDNEAVIQVQSKDLLVLIEKCSICECDYLNGNILDFTTTGIGSCSMISSIISHCQSTSGIVSIATDSSHSGSNKVFLTSACLCGTSSQRTYLSFFIDKGHQDCQEINMSKCYSHYHTFCENNSPNCYASWINMEENDVSSIVFYMNFKGIVKNSNFIKNKQQNKINDYYGILTTTDANSVLVAERCFFQGNNCESLCATEIGTVYFIQCCIDSSPNTKNAFILNKVTLEKNTFPNHYKGITQCQNRRLTVFNALFIFGVCSLSFDTPTRNVVRISSSQLSKP